MLKISSLFSKLVQFMAVTAPFMSSKVPQRPVLKGEVMPGSVSLLSKVAAFMLHERPVRFGTFLAPS